MRFFQLTLLCLASLTWADDTRNEQPLSFSFITTSYANPTAEAFLVKGGRLWHQRALVQGAVLVQHNDSLFLYDAGLGKNIDAQFAEFSWLGRKIFAHSAVTPVAEQLQAAGIPLTQIDFIVPSHLHWDHASGLPDFPDTPVWVQSQELAAARAGTRPSFLPETLTESVNWQAISLPARPFLGFERSLDVFGDGTVFLVNLPGHTAGQLGLYLEMSGNERYFFIGDASWTVKGIQNNKKRSWLIKRLVKLNDDEQQTQDTLDLLHELSLQDPDLVIVPVHDEQQVATLPQFPQGLAGPLWKSEP